MKQIRSVKAWGEKICGKMQPVTAETWRMFKFSISRNRTTTCRVRIIREPDYRELLRRARLNPHQPPFEGPIKGFTRKPRRRTTKRDVVKRACEIRQAATLADAELIGGELAKQPKRKKGGGK